MPCSNERLCLNIFRPICGILCALLFFKCKRDEREFAPRYCFFLMSSPYWVAFFCTLLFDMQSPFTRREQSSKRRRLSMIFKITTINWIKGHITIYLVKISKKILEHCSPFTLKYSRFGILLKRITYTSNRNYYHV